MDLSQTKLSKNEWNNTEVPITEGEKFILNVLMKGYDNVNIRDNMNKSMFEMIKIEVNGENEVYLYKKYFEKEIKDIISKYGKSIIKDFEPKLKNNKNIKKKDILRIENMDNIIGSKKSSIFEYELINICKNILKNIDNCGFYFYTLINIKKSKINNLNKFVIEFTNKLEEEIRKKIKIKDIIYSAYDFIEKNKYLLKYEDITLFEHQKKLFTVMKDNGPKLVLYIAPTGTGKTLSPIALTKQYKVIFICVSRHVGLALAKSAISMEKKIAFAFGCETASDIRLHYFAASTYIVNKRSGGIGKVDNSIGDKVEIMICDLKSYITAMHYMLSFNNEEDLILYWDEPTITLDYEDHVLHKDINRIWKENLISKTILSCATLPKEEELTDVIGDYNNKFDNAELISIESYDFKKSISVLDTNCNSVLLHNLYEDYDELIRSVRYCERNKTLLRYLDLGEVIILIKYLNDLKLIRQDKLLDEYFSNIEEITMDSLKTYYLKCLKEIDRSDWSKIYKHFIENRKNKFENNNQLKRISSVSYPKNNTIFKTQSVDNIGKNNDNPGLFITTRDAHTLTDGPTIYMVNDVNKIASFYLKVSNISDHVFNSIMVRISENNVLQEKITKLEQKREDKLDTNEETEQTKKEQRREENSPEIKKLTNEIDNLRSQIRMIDLNPIYVPNEEEHQKMWTGNYKDNAFKPKINETMVKRIMELEVSNTLKILLLLGIGSFDNENNSKYLEIMKELAYNQNLYLIIASTDYIYGTNYSFCHGYIGKDLTNMTQQKIMQAMGRIGRNKIQQDYTIRFRDNSIIKKLFEPIDRNIEAINMNRLFCSD